MNSQPPGLRELRAQVPAQISADSIVRLQVAITHYCQERAMPARLFVSGPGESPTRRAGWICSAEIRKVKQSEGRVGAGRSRQGGGRFLVPCAQAHRLSFWTLATPTLNQCPHPPDPPHLRAPLSDPDSTTFLGENPSWGGGVRVQPKGRVGGRGVRSGRFYMGQR